MAVAQWTSYDETLEDKLLETEALLDHERARVRQLEARLDDMRIWRPSRALRAPTGRQPSGWEVRSRLNGLPKRIELPGGVALEPLTCRVTLGDRSVVLGRTETLLLAALARRRGEAVSFGDIARRVWGREYRGAANTTRCHVSRIRQKLAAGHVPLVITAVWGIGLRLEIAERRRAEQEGTG